MPQNEDGEFELILGNRQLLSVFFIVVILLGVFFTMGYIVGRNSGTVTAEVVANPNPDARPQVVESPAKTPEPLPAPATPTETAPLNSLRPPHPRQNPVLRPPSRSVKNYHRLKRNQHGPRRAAIPLPDRPICN